MGTCKSLTEALMPRAVDVAELLSDRLPDAGLWTNYRKAEGLNGELKFDNLIEYHRPGFPKAKLVFRNPEMNDAKQVDRSEPVVLEANVDQRFRSHMVLSEPVTYSKTLSHTWGKTRTLDEQVKAGAEATVKAGLSGGAAGITATGEIGAKIYAEYLRRYGATETQSDTISDSFYFALTEDDLAQGPKVIDYEATRQLNREQRKISADCDYEHTVELIDETGAGVNPPRIQLVSNSWLDFQEVLQGFASAYTTWGDGRVTPRPFYEEFIHEPVRGERLRLLSAPADGSVQFTVEYDNVINQTIELL